MEGRHAVGQGDERDLLQSVREAMRGGDDGDGRPPIGLTDPDQQIRKRALELRVETTGHQVHRSL